MSFDDTKNAGDSITSQDWNEFVAAHQSKLGVPVMFPVRGSNCSGTDGTADRTLTLNNTSLTYDASIWVFVSNGFLHRGVAKDFTVVHNAASSVITFLNKIWDTSYIWVVYSV